MSDWIEAEKRIERAQELSESRQWTEALNEVEAAVEINPGNPSWHAQRGFLLDQLRRHEDAIESYRQAVTLQGDDPEVTTALGVDLIRIGRCAEAVAVFERLSAYDPDYEPAYCHRILAYSELGEHDRAEEMFYLAQQLDEDCPHCFCHVGVSLAQRGEYEQAIACWKRVLDLEPDFVGIKQRIAQAYRVQGDRELARDYYLAEIREDPGNTDLLFELGELHLEAGAIGPAVAKFRQIIELEPDHIPAHLASAEILLRNERPELALESLRSVEALDEECPGLELRIGEAYLLMGQDDTALYHLEKAAARTPDNTRTLMALGNCMLRLDRPGDGADLFRRILASNERDADAHHNLGVCCFLLGQYDNALEHFVRAVDLKPDFVMAMHKAALVCIRLAKWRQAEQLLVKARALSPDSEVLAQLSRRIWRYRVVRWIQRLSRPIRSLRGR